MRISIRDFFNLFWRRKQGEKIKFPKALEDSFLQDPQTPEEREIADLIREFRAGETHRLQAELFAQRKRLADAERTLQTKTTKAAQESQRIATSKIATIQGWLDDLDRTESLARDSQIFPGWYAPVIIQRDGEQLLMPMRYQCRLAGKPAGYDRQFPGTYNARRDSLEGFWKPAFAKTHAIMVATAFYENVPLHRTEGRELAPGEAQQNVVLEFKPRPEQDMLVACLYSHWIGPDEDLWSFAAITDEPPAEVAAAGHDRCIIPVKPENVDAWLAPESGGLASLYAIFDDRARPYYEHLLAA
jgi:putative SOS response-associated peptidase YedK